MEAEEPLNAIGEPGNRRSLAWRFFFEASTRLQGVLEARLKKATGTSLADYNILLALYESPGRKLRMGELADRVVFSPSRLTYLVSRLEKLGAVRKAPSTEDGRGYEAKLTEEGIALTEQVTAIHQDTVRELLLDELTDAEIDRIVDAFERVDEQFKNE